MLTDYIQAAIDSITWKMLDDGTFYAEIIPLGLNTSSQRLEECQCRIRKMLEEHIVISLIEHKPLPVIGGKEIKTTERL